MNSSFLKYGSIGTGMTALVIAGCMTNPKDVPPNTVITDKVEFKVRCPPDNVLIDYKHERTIDTNPRKVDPPKAPEQLPPTSPAGVFQQDGIPVQVHRDATGRYYYAFPNNTGGTDLYGLNFNPLTPAPQPVQCARPMQGAGMTVTGPDLDGDGGADTVQSSYSLPATVTDDTKAYISRTYRADVQFGHTQDGHATVDFEGEPGDVLYAMTGLGFTGIDVESVLVGSTLAEGSSLQFNSWQLLATVLLPDGTPYKIMPISAEKPYRDPVPQGPGIKGKIEHDQAR